MTSYMETIYTWKWGCDVSFLLKYPAVEPTVELAVTWNDMTLKHKIMKNSKKCSR